MRGVAGQHRTAARLRHVADQDAGPMADCRHLARKSFEKGEQGGMAPIAVARQPHHLPGRPVDGQRLAAGEAAARIKSDGARGERRSGVVAKQLLGRGRGSVGWASGGSSRGSSVPTSCARAIAPIPAANTATRQIRRDRINWPVVESANYE